MKFTPATVLALFAITASAATLPFEKRVKFYVPPMDEDATLEKRPIYAYHTPAEADDVLEKRPIYAYHTPVEADSDALEKRFKGVYAHPVEADVE